MRRYVLRNGYKRAGTKALRQFAEFVIARVDRTTSLAARMTALEGRCTVKGRDMDRAMKRTGVVII